MSRELSVEAVEGGALRGDLGGLHATLGVARLVDDGGVGLDNICNRRNETKMIIISDLL